jgi:Ni/Co efflux regulator RcnB
MKRLMSVMLALSFLAATVSVSFAQDTTKKEKKKGGKKGHKKESTEKKGGSL